MGDFDPSFIEALRTQSWSLYAVGMFIILLRMAARIQRLGSVRNLQLDDYLMMLAGGLYTALVVCLNVISDNGGSNLYPPEMAGTFTPAQVQARIYGSKIVVVSEQAMLNVIYTIKACMLLLYTRLTLGLAAQRAVRWLAVYVAAGWVASETAFFTACRPFSGYWGMPPPDPQCTTLQNYALVQGCFNISSDLLMLGIPLPLVARMNVPLRKKSALLFIFSMGLFVIVAALLTKIMNLTDIWDPTYMLWYVREASVAVYVSNLPLIWPLLRQWFPFLRHLTPSPDVMPTVEGRGHGGPGASSKKSSRKSGVGGGGGGVSSLPYVLSSKTPSSRAAMVARRQRNDSTGSLDSAYDLELEMKGQPGGGAGSSTVRVHAGHVQDASSSTEVIVQPPHHQQQRGESSGSVSASASASEADIATAAGKTGGIHVTVERTVVVQNEDRRASSLDDDEAERGVYDWDHHGRSQHHTKVASRGFR